MKRFDTYFEYISGFVTDSLVAGNHEISLVTCDSRQVIPGAVFCAIPGAVFDGHDFITQAIDNDAVAVICCHGFEALPADINKIKVSDPYQVYALLCEFFFDKPAVGS